VDIREPFEQVVGDGWQRRGRSPVVDGGWWCDLWEKPEEVSLSDKNWGKSTGKARQLSRRNESKDVGVELRLDGGSRGALWR
jgi:hypothetical protein